MRMGNGIKLAFKKAGLLLANFSLQSKMNQGVFLKKKTHKGAKNPPTRLILDSNK